MREYHVLQCRLNGNNEVYLLWFTADDGDGIALDTAGNIPAFANRDEAVQYFAAHCTGDLRNETPPLYDLDALQKWTETPEVTTADCTELLNAWNLFNDAAASIPDETWERTDKANDDLYQKLFWGNNLPAVTPHGKEYIPIWQDAEIARMQGVLASGLKCWKRILFRLRNRKQIMRIAIDGRALTGRYTGDRTYWRNLLLALLRCDTENSYLIYSRLPIPPGELPDAPNVVCRVLPAANDRVWTLYALPKAVRLDRADLLHVQYTSPLHCACPVVTTVHDISFRLFPQWFPARHRVLLNMTVPPSMRRAAAVITDSESSRRDMLRVYKLPPSKIAAIPLGLPEGFDAPSDVLTQEASVQIASERYGLDAPFVLAVGVLQPRKNLNMLAEAFGRMKAAHNLPHKLAIVGKAGWGMAHEALLAGVVRGGASPHSVVFTGYVPDDDLPALYRACRVFAYPSLYEGFGFPPLEAMACGAACVVSNAPAMPEVCGDAALSVPPNDVNAWADALYRVLTEDDLRQELSRRGRERARCFDWQETADRTLAVYRQAVSR